MDAIAAIGSSLGSAFSGPGGLGNILKTVLTGGGLLGNFLSQRQQQGALNQELKYQKNPALAASKIASLEQPLSQGLIQDVGNSTQGYLAERGLAESPQQSTAVLGQALAPYVQQNQNTAMQEFMALLNPTGAQFSKPTNLASLFSLFNKNPYPTMGGGATPPFTAQGTGGYYPPTPGTDSPPNFGDTFSDFAGVAA
jgi:hypothetical protein